MVIQVLIRLSIVFIRFFTNIKTMEPLYLIFHCRKCRMRQEGFPIMIFYCRVEVLLMKEQIEEYAKRLKLSWIREHYHEVEATNNQEYLLKLFEMEVQQREERKVNLLLKQAQLPNTGAQPVQWEHIQIPQGIDREAILQSEFIHQKSNLILYGGVGTGKTYLATLISLNAIHRFGRKVKFFTVASLANKLI